MRWAMAILSPWVVALLAVPFGAVTLSRHADTESVPLNAAAALALEGDAQSSELPSPLLCVLPPDVTVESAVEELESRLAEFKLAAVRVEPGVWTLRRPMLPPPNPSDYFHWHFDAHTLQVQNLWMGLPMYEEQAHPRAPDNPPHDFGECQLWDNSATAIASLKYSTTNPGNADGRILVCGGRIGSSKAVYEADPDGYAYLGAVLGSTHVFHHNAPLTVSWNDFESAETTVSSLPTSQVVHSTPEPLAAVVAFEDDVGWEWQYDSRCGEHTNEDTAVGPPEVEWIAKSYDYPVVDGQQGPQQSTSECTPKRVAAAYGGLAGTGSGESVAEYAAAWVRGKCTFWGFCWDANGGAPEDAWCILCNSPPGGGLHHPGPSCRSGVPACRARRHSVARVPERGLALQVP